jgi:putative tricarboxylic transport membrane protein
MADQAPVTDHASASQGTAVPDPVRPMLPRVIGPRRAGLLAAGVLALTGLLFAWQASLLDLGQIGLPGPGFFPLVLGGLLVFFAGAIAIEGRLVSSKLASSEVASSKDEPLEFGHAQVLITFAALLAVPLLFELLGAYITLGLMSAVLLVFIARVSLLLAVVSSAVGMAACWYVFGELLGVRLPTGLF